MTSPDRDPNARVVADLVAELAEVSRPPQFLDRLSLDRLNTAFGRVRDMAPDVYGANPAVAGFHFQTDYFADPSEDLDLMAEGVQLDLFDGGQS